MSQTLRSNKVNAVKTHTTICATCLSSGRILYPMKLLPHLLNICNGVTLTMKDNICWECKAQLLKTLKFRNKAVRSQSVLTHLAHIKQVATSTSGQQGVFVESLSSLSKNELFHWGVASKTGIKEEVTEFEIKGEELNDNAASYELLTKVEGSELVPPKRELSADSDNEGSARETTDIDNVEASTIQVVDEEEKEAPDKDDPPNFNLKILNEVEMMQSIEKIEEIELVPSKRELSADSDNEGSDRETTDIDNVEATTVQMVDEEEKKAPDKNDPPNFNLKILNEVEMMQSREKEKNKRWYKSSKYRCETCIQTFRNELMLEKHNELHSEKNGSHTCSVCKQRFEFDDAMQIHMKAHYKYYRCRDCEFIHQHMDNMVAHWKRKHDHRKRQCDQCDAQFNSYRRLAYHKELRHKAHPRPRCDICGREFIQNSTLKRHMLIHTGVPKVECTICHKQYRYEMGLRWHMRQDHSTSSNEVNVEAYCAECGTQFKDIYGYRTHLRVSRKHAAPETDRFECSECGKKFFQKSFLQHHIENTHLKLGNHPCDICKKKFNSYSSLRRHKREKHSNRQRKRHVCQVCGKSFAEKRTLKDHMNAHTGARPYKCNVCGDTFAYSAALFTHNRLVHLKQKCGKKATGTHL